MYFHWNTLDQYQDLLKLEEAKWPVNLFPVKKWYEEQELNSETQFKRLTPLPDNNIQRQYERFP